MTTGFPLFYQRIIFFRNTSYPQTFLFLHFSPQIKQVHPQCWKNKGNRYFSYFLDKLIIYLPKFRFAFISRWQFSQHCAKYCCQLIYLLIYRFLSLAKSLGPRAVLWVSFAQSKCRVNQHTIKIGSQATIIKNSCEEYNGFRKQNPKIVKCHEFVTTAHPQMSHSYSKQRSLESQSIHNEVYLNNQVHFSIIRATPPSYCVLWA